VTSISEKLTQKNVEDCFYPIIPLSFSEDDFFYKIQARYTNPHVVKKLSLLFSTQVSVERIPLEEREEGARFLFIIPKESVDFLN